MTVKFKHEDLIFNLHEYNIHPDNREIFLNGYVSNVDEEPGVDYRMASTFIKNAILLDKLNDKPITIHMNTCGGSWNYGMAIYDTILNLRSHITIIAYAHARSMSSIILQAADKRLMMPSADFLIHYGTFEIAGNHRSAESEIEWSKKTTDVMLKIYLEKCKHGNFFKKWSSAKIYNYLIREIDKKQEWYMSAEEAVDKGFADGIIGKDYKLHELEI